MLFADLTDRVFARSDQLLWLWNFYVAVVIVTLASVFLVPAIREQQRLRIGLMTLFAFVAYANLESMRWVLKQWHSLVEANRALLTPSAIDAVLGAPHPLWVFPFHLTLDAFVLITIWRLSRPQSASPR